MEDAASLRSDYSIDKKRELFKYIYSPNNRIIVYDYLILNYGRSCHYVLISLMVSGINDKNDSNNEHLIYQ